MLSHVKINNFKTYRGEYVVGPLRQSTVVRGRNGSGKMNQYRSGCKFMCTGNPHTATVNLRQPDLSH